MQRMRSAFVKIGLLPVLVMELGAFCSARGDLIRPSISRSYPDIAGDLVGSQTYTFDPSSKTGVFQVVNAPQFIALGPTGKDMLNVTPDKDGTLSQSLQLRLDQNGQMVQTPDNRFQLYGSVVIGDQIYRGLLLEGTPTAFGARRRGPRRRGSERLRPEHEDHRRAVGDGVRSQGLFSCRAPVEQHVSRELCVQLLG